MRTSIPILETSSTNLLPKKQNPPAAPPLVYANNNNITSASTPNLATAAASSGVQQKVLKKMSDSLDDTRLSTPSLTTLTDKTTDVKPGLRHRRTNSSSSIADIEAATKSDSGSSATTDSKAKEKRDIKAILQEGILEVKSSKDWAKRYVILRRGYFAIYRLDKRDMKTSECVGLVRLEGCTFNMIGAKKHKYVFEVTHDKKQRIYCHAGPQGERVFQKMPSRFDRCSLRTREKDEVEDWTASIEDAIKEAPPYLKFTEDDIQVPKAEDQEVEKEDGESDSDDESDGEDSEDDDESKPVFDEIKEAIISEEPKKVAESIAIRNEIVIPPEIEKESSKVVGKDGDMKINLKGGWVKYYFILGSGVLAFYKTNEKKELIGSIELEGCEIRRVDSEDKKKQKFVIEITHPGKKRIFSKESSSGRKLNIQPILLHTCQLRVKTDNSCIEWIAAIQLMINESQQTSTIPLISPEIKSQSVGWLNIILHRHFKDMAASKVFHNEMMRRMKKKFDTMNRPDFLGPIVCEKIFFGTEMVQVKSLRFANTKDSQDEIVGEADLVYNGGGGLEISTELFVNWPRDKFASIPVNAQVKLAHLSGKMHIHLPAEPGARMSAFFAKLPEVDFSVEMLVGKKQMEVTGLPKFKKFIIATLRRALRQQLVYPNQITLHIPFPGRKLDLKTETWGSRFRRRTTYNSREAPNPSESTDIIARKFTVARFFNEFFNHNNFDGISEICLKEIVLHGFNPFNEEAVGFEGVMDVVSELRTGFSNMKVSLADIAIETNNAFCRFKLRGTNDGPFWDCDPTNEEMMLTGIVVLQFNTDRVYEAWAYWDPSSVFAF
eukprot:TRINITY_DN222_c0_g5_i1.p1 TRINITY_DN222_c0_g5~~TRINITY_DN222_c0_g5_i1.p1  ORF type:complete len:833 (+),score=225.40 TRINITY_DN222_c0_g5_i1:1599-4097(+)